MVINQTVGIIAYNHHGHLTPLKIRLSDRWIPIDRIYSVSDHSIETGGYGRMYVIQLNGYIRRLFHTDQGWCLLTYGLPMAKPIPQPGIIP